MAMADGFAQATKARAREFAFGAGTSGMCNIMTAFQNKTHSSLRASRRAK